MEETHPEAAAVLRDAGWKPHDVWGVFTRDTLVMGSPRVGEFHVKNTARCADSADTPDDPVEAARWLVARFPVAAVVEPEQTVAHETDSSTRAQEEYSDSDGDIRGVHLREVLEVAPEGASGVSSEPTDAEFFEEGLTAPDLEEDYGAQDLLIEGSDFADVALEPEPQGGAFIFGDNLHQMRTSAIGLVVQAALERMPEAIDYARMSELRNFTMGVSEGRWPDDPDKREELDTLEATERLRRAVEAARDTKVAALLSATREEIEAFDVDAGWP